MRSKGVVWFGFILLLASMIPNLMQAYIVYAQSSDEVRETIIQTDTLKVTTNVKQVNDQMRWELQYQWSTPTENSARRLKLKFYDNEGKAEKNVDTSLVQPEHIDGWRLNENNWFMNEEFKTSAEGTVVVMTALSVKNLALRIQLDEEIIKEVERVKETISSEELSASQESSGSSEVVTTFNNETEVEVIEEKIITEDILQTPDADVHELSAPEIDAPVTSSSEVADTSQEEVVTPSEETSETTVESQMPETSEIESSPSETSSSSEETASTEEALKEAENLVQNFQYNAGIAPFAVASYTDPFAYIPDGGQYPTHGTNNYSAALTSPFVKNYNYGSTADSVSGVPVKNILNTTPLNFDKGYHAHQVTTNPAQDIYLKKIAMPTSDPTKFKVQLDMIGGYLQTRRNVDVVFVVDKSGSMEGSNWTVLKNSLNTFANSLLGSTNNADGAVRLGLASFGGARVNNNWTAFGEIGNFGGTIGNYTGFTTSASSFLSHTILNVTPTGGTPTFLGLDAGLDLLVNPAYNSRTDAAKVLIILTDGLPTYAPTTTYTGIRQTSSNSSNAMTRTQPNADSTVERFTAGSNLFTGDGSTTPQSTRNAIIAHANSRSASYPNIDRYAIGFNVSNVGDILSALGPKGQYSATSQSDLTAVMNNIKQKIIDISALIREAKVFDPMSSYVTLDAATVKTSALQLNLSSSPRTLTVIPSTSGSYPTYASDVVIDKTGNKINLSNLTLAGDSTKLNGFRVEYEVTLKEEYRDGKFYPANGPTYLADDQYTNPFGFAIPSVKKEATTFDIPVTKEWIDDNNTWTTRQSISLQLQKKVGTTWVDVPGKSITLPVGTTSYTFTGIQAYESGLKIDYAIKETPTRVTGYKAPVYTPASVNISSTNKTLKVTNELLKTKIEFTKVKSDGTTPLAGVGFTLFKANGTTAIGTQVLSDATGKVSFPTQLPIGSYVVKETLTLPGYEPIDPMNLVVSDTNATLSVNGLPTGNKVVNRLKDFKLIVKKLDTVGNAVNGAKFKLESTTTSPPYSNELLSSNNLFEFTGLKPGTYTLTETQTPDGYIGLQNPITIMIDLDGNVKVDDVSQSGVITGEGNIIKIDVKNRQKGQLPSTGGNGTQQYLIVTFILASLASVIGIYYVYRNRKGAK